MINMSKQSNQLSFAERTAQTVAEQNVWQQYNAEAEFNTENMVETLEELADKTFPSDSFNSNAYQEAIVNSLTGTISPEVGVNDFWRAMGKAGCKTCQIVNGRLNFFDNQGEKIDITPYTQPIIFEAHSSYYEQRQIERKERIDKARAQLQELLEEIHRR